MTRRRSEAQEDRRKPRVELNLLAEEESAARSLGRALDRRRRGCFLPFSGVLVALTGFELVRAILG